MKTTWLMILFLLITTSSFAQHDGPNTKGGGGGNAVACYKDGTLDSVVLLDLYEGSVLGINHQLPSEDFEEALVQVGKRLGRENNPGGLTFSSFALMLSKNFKRIPDGAKLVSSQDAFPVFIPKNCKIEQVANYYNDRTIWIDGELYDKMSSLDKLGLVVHETLYREERLNGVPDSRYARKMTSMALAEVNMLKAPVTDSTKSIMHCHAVYSVGKTRGTSFYIVPVNGEFQLQFDYIFGHKVYTKTFLTLGDISMFTTEIENSDFSVRLLDSTVHDSESVVLQHTGKKVFLSWEGSDPGDAVGNEELECVSTK